MFDTQAMQVLKRLQNLFDVLLRSLFGDIVLWLLLEQFQ
jgi:hypothetical protein